MTVIISLPHPKLIVMCADNRKTTFITQLNPLTNETIGESVEYSDMTKMFPVPGIGCATLWGDDVTRAENLFPEFLEANYESLKTVEDLRDLVDDFLHYPLKAELDGADIGFHISGFMPDRTPYLNHVFWGWDRVHIEGQEPSYRSYPSETFLALYNGRNDLVDPIMRLLVNLQEQVGVTIFNEDAIQRIILVDFLTRYISQFTPDVGSEIHTALITPSNRILYIRNPQGAILSRQALENALDRLNESP